VADVVRSQKRCAICGRPAAYIQRYSGTSLCERCFTKTIRRRVWKEISRNHLVQTGERVVFAVSGGKDSVASLDIVHRLEKRKRVEMAVLTIDEGISGYRSKGIEKAKAAAEERDLEFQVASFKEAFGGGLDSILRERGVPERSCTYCGVLRRWLLNRTAREMGADKLVTGHNLDDEIQSALLNMVRGDPARIARAGPSYVLDHPKLVPRVKPLRRIPGRETLLYDLFNHLDVHLGSCPYSGFDMRNVVREFFNRLEETRPTSKNSFLSTVDRIAEQMRASYEGYRLSECEICGEPSAGRVCKACQLLGS